MFDGHGDDTYRYGDRIKHNFSTNIIADADHSGLMARLSRNFNLITGYPEPQPLSLERKIAGWLEIPEKNVAVTNGATDAIYRLAHIYRDAVSAIGAPSFREYQDACRLNSHNIIFFENLDDLHNETDLIWICNPNNPTGKAWEKNELLSLAESRRDTILIIDQAYADYTSKPVVTVQEAIDYGNIVLLNSLTKRFSVPGLRIGYTVASADICGYIREHGTPWAVSAPAISAAEYLISHTDQYAIDKHLLHSEALRIAEAFKESGIGVSDTDCNFILCRLPHGRKASDLKDWLVENKGILIRDASNFEGLDAGYFRVAAQSCEENDFLIKSVEEWIRG